MDNVIFLESIPDFPPVEKAIDPNYIKHVICEDARFHVPWCDTNGEHCSEPKCIINKGKENVRKQTRKDKIRRRSGI